VGDFRSAAALGAGPVREAVFGMGTTLLIKEVIAQLLNEQGMSEEEKSSDLNSLRGLEAQYKHQAKAAVSDVSLRVQQFARMCKDMRRMLSGLEMTRIMCKIERSKALGDTEGLDEIVNRLLHAEKDIGGVMTDIDNAIRDILEASERLMRGELSTARAVDVPQKLSA
jgi:aerotaxis receptor